ncbi:MAG: GNAT family N-acetyltransferase [Gemmatimonadaceae bacterium]|nr:GNAT family N-acetyltransferase [Gemmatimonadaceae bacterium]
MLFFAMIPTADSPITIRAGVPTDDVALADLARRTFADTFGDDNTAEDLATFLDATYGPDIQRRELTTPGLQYLVAERDGAMVAYALLRHKCSPHVTDPTAIEVQRFYVDRAGHGRGIAQRLMVACIAEAAARGAGSLWLGVWERNARAIRFYAAQGFREVGTQTFVVGSDPQTDVVMARPIPDDA